MKKYIILYLAPPALLAKAMKKTTPAQRKETMKGWMAWKKSSGKSIVDLGAPLDGGFALTKKSSKASNKSICGYSILKAKDKNAVKKLLKNHPHNAWSSACSIEVHEALPMK